MKLLSRSIFGGNQKEEKKESTVWEWRNVSTDQEFKEEQEDALDGDWDAGILKYLKTLGHSTSRILL